MLKKYLLLASILYAGLFFSPLSHAQFLPDNTTLNVQSVQRWMQSNRDFASVIQVLDELNKTENDSKKFDALPAVEQDQKITAFLQQKQLLESANKIASQHGWKSLGEYVRLSTKLGNAIAAYFYTQEAARLTEEQKKALQAKTDPVVLSVPASDITFVKNNEKLLKSYIQAYSKGK
ncbi:MAG: hypothetical protein EOO52_09050 [Gammaproteobacteria bacterium]|nr:MAG: hypothetical protein EOO52_09050 [Gammaproteobacteria bacterium]